MTSRVTKVNLFFPIATTMPREDEPLLPRAQPKPTPRLLTYLKQEVSPRRGDLVLLLCYVITGLLDSSAFFIWGSFVSMQTGNTVYLGLGLAQADPDRRWVKSGLSIASFCVGSYFFGAFYQFCGPSARRRWALCASFLFQALLVGIAAVIVTLHRHHHHSTEEWRVLVPLCLVAFQSSGQAVTSRILECRGLTSVVLTSVYCDLFSNPIGLNIEQRRRAAAILCLGLGTMLGGLWAKSPTGLSGALWTAVALKGGIGGAWMVWPGVDE